MCVCVYIYIHIYNFNPFHQKVFQVWNALKISPRDCVTINRLCGPLHLSELNTNRYLVPEIHIALCVKAFPKTGGYSQGFHFIFQVEHKTPHHLLCRFILMGAKCEWKILYKQWHLARPIPRSQQKKYIYILVQFNSVTQSCSTLCDPINHSTPGFTVHTNSRGLLIEAVMPSDHFICCCPLLLLPSNFPSLRFFSNESALPIRWPAYWSFSFKISPSKEHSGLISCRIDCLDLLAVQGTLKSLL